MQFFVINNLKTFIGNQNILGEIFPFQLKIGKWIVSLPYSFKKQIIFQFSINSEMISFEMFGFLINVPPLFFIKNSIYFIFVFLRQFWSTLVDHLYCKLVNIVLVVNVNI